MRILLPLSLLLACGSKDPDSNDDDGNTCGPGTHEEGDLCVADDEGDADTDSDADGDTDADADADADGDSDADADADSDADADYTVCGDGTAPFTDIQDAVDDAVDGDTITICAGVYDYVTIDRVSVALKGLDSPEATIVTGGSNAAITVDSQEVTLEGLTLTGELNNYGPAALSCTSGVVHALRIRVADLTSTSMGGYGVLLDGCEADFESLTMENNSVNGSLLTAFDGGSLLIRHAVVRDNFDAASGGGGGIGLGQVDVELSNSIMYRNELTGDLISANSTVEGVQQWVYNNTLFGNVGDGSGRSAIAVNPALELVNNIVVSNRGYAGIGGGTEMADYNDSWDNDIEDYSWLISGTGNISEDPKFTDADAFDMTLNVGFSPCIDTGNPLAGYNDVDGSRNDMGAYGGPYGAW